MKRRTPILAIALMVCTVVPALAEAPQKGNRGKKGDAAAQAGDGNQVAGDRQRRRGPGGGGPGAGGPGAGGPGAGRMDPARMVPRLMQEFDQDGDKKLDANELTKLLVAMRERMSGRGGPGGAPGAGAEGMRRRPGQNGKGPGENGKGPGGGKNRRGAGALDENAEVGGDRPKRP